MSKAGTLTPKCDTHNQVFATSQRLSWSPPRTLLTVWISAFSRTGNWTLALIVTHKEWCSQQRRLTFLSLLLWFSGFNWLVSVALMEVSVFLLFFADFNKILFKYFFHVRSVSVLVAKCRTIKHVGPSTLRHFSKKLSLYSSNCISSL